jgi:hypothetical protein
MKTTVRMKHYILPFHIPLESECMKSSQQAAGKYLFWHGVYKGGDIEENTISNLGMATSSQTRLFCTRNL